VISQVYGGGGNAGSVYKNDFVELYNSGDTAVSLTGWSVQYGSSGGTSWQVTSLTGTIQPGKYYLVQEALGAGGTTNLPTPDASGTIAMSATAGKVTVSSSTTPYRSMPHRRYRLRWFRRRELLGGLRYRDHRDSHAIQHHCGVSQRQRLRG